MGRERGVEKQSIYIRNTEGHKTDKREYNKKKQRNRMMSNKNEYKMANTMRVDSPRLVSSPELLLTFLALICCVCATVCVLRLDCNNAVCVFYAAIKLVLQRFIVLPNRESFIQNAAVEFFKYFTARK